MKALFLTKYGMLGGSSRHMVYSYLEFYEAAGIECTVAPLFDDRYFAFRKLSTLPTTREILQNLRYFLTRVIDRLVWIAKARRFDLIVMEYELLPYAPFGLERLLQVDFPRTISLYDDAVYETYAQHPNWLVRGILSGKIAEVMRHSEGVIAWNRSLGDYARQFNQCVVIARTALDVRRYRVKTTTDRDASGRSIIGWIGTPNSFPFLALLEPVFARLARSCAVELRVVSSREYASESIRVSNRKWALETEVNDLCSFDIGIMPLADDAQTRGKSGYKAVQYMAVGIPAVCSPVGVNRELIQDGVNGYLAESPDEWYDVLMRLIQDAELRRQLGAAGRKLVEQEYATQAIAPRLVSALRGSG